MNATATSRRRSIRRGSALASLPFSVGVLIILALGVVAWAAALIWPPESPPGVRLWLSARLHYQMYAPVVDRWNAQEPDPDKRLNLTLLSLPALERRMLSGFLSQTPTAELLEVERRVAARAFVGPLDAVGFVDLTDRLRSDGLLDRINGPSFSPWSSRGRVFGIPHDVHPVMLGYRADIIEAAGIDVTQIKTWDDFARVLSPLMSETGTDGQPKHWLLNFWPTQPDLIEVLLLQAGGGYFDDSGRPTVDCEANARVLATLVSWCVGKPYPQGTRIAADSPDFSASGNALKVQGYTLAALMPDWMCNVWRHEMPQLAGKVKVMPLPAWPAPLPSQRRTSVWGGTMLGISRTAPDFERLYTMAKRLYLSDELARELYTVGDIISPSKDRWVDPIYDQPDSFFSGQAKGRLYINLAPDVPARSSSPYYMFARDRVQDALLSVRAFAEGNGLSRPEDLLPQARLRLAEAQRSTEGQVARNMFLTSDRKDETRAVNAGKEVAP